MKSIVDDIVREAEARLAFLRGELEDKPDSCDLMGRVMEAEHNVANVRLAQDVMMAELNDMHARFAQHTHTPGCGHSEIILPDVPGVMSL